MMNFEKSKYSRHKKRDFNIIIAKRQPPDPVVRLVRPRVWRHNATMRSVRIGLFADEWEIEYLCREYYRTNERFLQIAAPFCVAI